MYTLCSEYINTIINGIKNHIQMNQQHKQTLLETVKFHLDRNEKSGEAGFYPMPFNKIPKQDTSYKIVKLFQPVDQPYDIYGNLKKTNE